MKDLYLPTTSLKELKESSLVRRTKLIKEAIKFPKTKSKENKKTTILYSFRNYEIGVQKPGKEFFSTRIKNKLTGQPGNNKNDMFPSIFKKGQFVDKPGSFEEIFKQFLLLMDSERSLQLMGCLMVRNAFTLDHKIDKNGKLRYTPPKSVIKEIKKELPKEFPEPLEVFLSYLEVIALNEDVKYFTLDYDIKTGIGRQNNLLTYANIINVILLNHHVEIRELLTEFFMFSGQMARNRGTNAMSIKKAIEVFPQLNLPELY